MKKFLKGLAIIVLVVVAVPFIAAFFIKKEYHAERSVELPVQREMAFNYLVLLKNQQDYGVWDNDSIETSYTYRGTDGTVGFVSAWESEDKNIGKGEQEIVAIVPNERIDYRLRFVKPFRSESESWFVLEDAGLDKTRITWGVKGRMGYPLNFFLWIVPMDSLLEDNLEQGLQNVKEKIGY
jgi:hypothetical protein